MKKIFYGWWVVAACFIIGLYVSGVVFYGFTAFFEPLIKEFGWSYTQVSFAASLRGMEMGIFAPVIGLLADRLGPRKVILTGVILVGFGLLLLSFTHSLLMFYGSFLLISLGAGGCLSLVTMSAVANWFDKNVGKAMGLMASGFGASGLLVPVIVWMIEAFQWRTAVILLGLGTWLMGIPLSFVVRDHPEKAAASPDPSLKEAPSPADDEPERRGVADYKGWLRNRSFQFLCLTEALRMIAVTAVTTHIMPYLTSVGMSRSRAGVVAAAIPLVSILGRVGFGWLSDIFEKKLVISLALGFNGVGILALAYAGTDWLILPFLLFFAPSYGGMTVLRGALLRDYFGKASFGKMLGFLMGFSAVGGVIGPTMAGWAFDTFGSYHLSWLAMCGLTLMTILLVLRIKR